MQEYKHQYYLNNKEKILKRIKNYRKEHPEKKTVKNNYYTEYWEDIRKQFFNMYGNKCVCCGESCETFLVLDHIKGKNRKSLTNRQSYLDALLVYKPEEYRTLCHNCNQATNGGRICPHQTNQIKKGR